MEEPANKGPKPFTYEEMRAMCPLKPGLYIEEPRKDRLAYEEKVVREFHEFFEQCGKKDRK